MRPASFNGDKMICFLDRVFNALRVHWTDGAKINHLYINNMNSYNFSYWCITKCALLKCQCIQHESANWGHYFYASYWRRDRHFMWWSEPREVRAIFKRGALSWFLIYFKILRILYWSGPENQTHNLPCPKKWKNKDTADISKCLNIEWSTVL